MGRYIAVVEHEGGRYWISFPSIQKTYSSASQPGEIVPHARQEGFYWVILGQNPPKKPIGSAASAAARLSRLMEFRRRGRAVVPGSRAFPSVTVPGS
jgi:hypothetical protein